MFIVPCSGGYLCVKKELHERVEVLTETHRMIAWGMKYMGRHKILPKVQSQGDNDQPDPSCSPPWLISSHYLHWNSKSKGGERGWRSKLVKNITGRGRHVNTTSSQVDSRADRFIRFRGRWAEIAILIKFHKSFVAEIASYGMGLLFQLAPSLP